jgi:hypothetical protein
LLPNFARILTVTHTRLVSFAPELLSALEQTVQPNGLLSISRDECAIMIELIANSKGE